MAANPGEENVATLFGDVHYFYGDPAAKPRHHRFDKTSYVYLFEDASSRRARIEIANHVGTDDQDAAEGFLDLIHVEYSYRHSCMVSLAVGDTAGNHEWHLPTYDPQNQNKYHYKLHSLDIYFWTQNDALQFLNNLRRILPSSQIDVQDEPGPPSTAVSPIVRQLETTVVSDAVYTTPIFIPGPPPGVPSVVNSVASPLSITSTELATTIPATSAATAATTNPAPEFVPMAYNPAAPAAPEQHVTREKTPPPEDDSGVNPLATAMAVDYQQSPFTPGFRLPADHPAANGMASPGFAPIGMMGFAPPPHSGMNRIGAASSSSYISIPPPPPPLLPSTQQIASVPGVMTSGTYNPSILPQNVVSSGQQHESQPHKVVPSAAPVAGSGLTPASTTEPTPLISPPPTAGHPSQVQHQPQSQAEINPQLQSKPTTLSGGKLNLDAKAARLEKGVTGMLRKFEKKFG
ncbi:hypothetical protein Cpir12675_001828 [Ceratocystis pirilliformis]|uniref:RNA recognition motif-containing protein n=1 Tax=Ceratocystis pirilliformis TaxID=259994 RepID=A0ABR3ZGF3_9PEZI